MKITVCIGSSCHLKGSRQVVEGLRKLICNETLEDKIELKGTFCMGNCKSGVCVMVDQDTFSVTPESVRTFFETEVSSRFR